MCCVLCLVAQLCLILCDPMDCSPPGSSVRGDSPGKSTGVDCHFLLQGIFPTQESNRDFLHCRQILYQLSYQGSPGSPYNEFIRVVNVDSSVFSRLQFLEKPGFCLVLFLGTCSFFFSLHFLCDLFPFLCHSSSSPTPCPKKLGTLVDIQESFTLISFFKVSSISNRLK